MFCAVSPFQTRTSRGSQRYFFKFKCCNLIFKGVKIYNLTYHNYQYLFMMSILNLLMVILKAMVMTRLTKTLKTVILTRTVVNIILMIKAELVLLTWMMSNNCSYITVLVNSFITEIYIAPLQGYYSEALPTLARLKRRVLKLE